MGSELLLVKASTLNDNKATAKVVATYLTPLIDCCLLVGVFLRRGINL